MDERVRRYAELLEVGQIITSEMNFDTLFPLLVQHTNSIMGTEASTIFLFDKKAKELWSLVTTNLGKSEIRIPANHGLAGWVFQHETYTLVDNAYDDPRFDSSVDAKTGFRTRNILSVPLINRQKECIGVLQTLNNRNGGFEDADVEVITSLSNYATVALENSRLYEDLKAMNKARERALSHLSHELKTPLSLIAAVLGAVAERHSESDVQGVERNIDLALRNVVRLLRLQREIDGIMKEKVIEYRTKVSRMVEDCLHFVEYHREVDHGACGDVLELLLTHLASIYKADKEATERFSVETVLRDICGNGRRAMDGRGVDIVEDFSEGPEIVANRSALETVFNGILRNAIENSPDEGRIEVTTRSGTDHVAVLFRDFGTGITAENQKLIFTGFFHTQDTDRYSTKTPYAFNAGGSGADLLRARVFSERYGFTIEFESTRCAFIPEDTDECPGRISRCPFTGGNPSRCADSGTVFTVTIPTGKRDDP